MIPWLVAGLSAILLVAGGVIWARSSLLPRVARQAEKERRLRGQLDQAISDIETLRRSQVRAPGDSSPAAHRIPTRSGDDFGEGTALPAPQGYFAPSTERSSAPGLVEVSEGEYELQAGDPTREEEGGDLAGAQDPRDATRQFKLHSPEAVVHFLQRIDELSDENRELRTTLADLEVELREHRVEGGEHVQRFAALDATAGMLREELKRRNVRIKQLEELLEGERLTGVPTRPDPASRGIPPPVPPDPLEGHQDKWPRTPEAPQDPTLRVRCVEESELRASVSPKPWKRTKDS